MRENARVVVAPIQCHFLADVGKFDIMIIDEAIEGVLFASYMFRREDWEQVGVGFRDSESPTAPTVFPTEARRVCDKTSALYPECLSRGEDVCQHDGPVLSLIPHVTREPENDEEYFIHQGLQGTVFGAWDHYNSKPVICVFDFFPIYDVDELHFASATVTRDLIEKWFFRNHKRAGWTFEFSESPRPYENPIETIVGRGTVNDVDVALREGTFQALLRRHNIELDKLLIVCKKQHENSFRMLFPTSYVDHFPLVGIDFYKDVADSVLVTCRFRRPFTVRYLLATMFSPDIVRAIEEGDIVQAIGRIRPLQFPFRHVICYFDFVHDLFPNTRRLRDANTTRWLENSGFLTPIRALYERARRDDAYDGHLNYRPFSLCVRRLRTRIRETTQIPVSGALLDPREFYILRYLSDPSKIRKNDLKTEFGRLCGRWKKRRDTYVSRANIPKAYFIATGLQPSGRTLVVVDLDGRGDLDEFLRERKLPRTLTVRTQSGGYHLYYHVNATVPNASKLLGTAGFDAVDVRGDGGIVFGPGTKFLGGAPYTIVEGGWDTISDIDVDRLNRAIHVRQEKATPSGIPAQIVPRKLTSGHHIPVRTGIRNWPPCVKLAYDRVHSGNAQGGAGHYTRLLLATFLTLLGTREDVVVRQVRICVDFNADVTRVQVRSVKNYSPWRCSTVQVHGLCPGDCHKKEKM